MPKQRTLGQTLSGMSLPETCIILGFAVVIIGSIGPWVSNPLASAGGMTGDGKITLGAAIIGLIAFFAGRADRTVVMLIGLGITALGVWEAYHIHNRIKNIVAFGSHIDSVGWGVYAVIGGGAIACVAAAKSTSNSRQPLNAETARPSPK